MDLRLTPLSAPELVIGLVAPIGTDLDRVTEVLSELLQTMNYKAHLIRLTELMRDVPIKMELCNASYIDSIKDRITFANEVRRRLGDDALAALAVSAIRNFRENEWINKNEAQNSNSDRTVFLKEDSQAPVAYRSPRESPLPNQAYIIRQFKRPEEISLLRNIYRDQFISISAYAPDDLRFQMIKEKQRLSKYGLISEVDCHKLAYEIMSKDARELDEAHGQNVIDTFALGDVFIDTSSRKNCENTLARFVSLLFGDNHLSPTRDEYGMYLAKCASLQSLDLSRQVGAAIFDHNGDIISLGCNEVPKAGGGTYWCTDELDQRDYARGFDPNERMKVELLVDVLDRLAKMGALSPRFSGFSEPHQVLEALNEVDRKFIKDSRLMDLIEFGRIVHAEMAAICDAARKGISIKESTLYTTTFPCHLCAKHIVASGIRRVVYLEPYPKSYAKNLHSDSIDVEGHSTTNRVLFEPFIGVSPFRYRELFEKGKRKYSGGLAKKWNNEIKKPIINVVSPGYFESELVVAESIGSQLDKLIDELSA